VGSGPRTAAGRVTALLRPAVEGDLGEVVRIERACFADPWTEESFRRLTVGEPAIFLVAVFPPDSAIAGYAIAFSVGEDAEVLNVAVDPSFRGKGLAGQMLDAVLIELGARGVRTAFLEVRESNRAARALYGSRGFTEIGRRIRYYRRPVEDALVMRRILEVAEGDEERSAGTFADR
jgi:ribosomal-protein-alanine N-acetyltransferase